MRTRLIALCVVLLGVALGAAGCSSSGSSSATVPVPKPTGTPAGTVTVKNGNQVVCVITLNKNGTGTCKVTAPAAGKYPLVGIYDGDGKFTAKEATTTLTVTPAAPDGPSAQKSS
jgi:hypothetical protein